LGVVIFLLAVASLAVYGRRSRRARSPVGPALICFGVLFALSITYGRSHFGLSVASQSRYVTFDLLILVGCYLCLIERWPAPRDKGTMAATDKECGAGPVVDEVETAPEQRRQRVLVTLRVLTILLIVWTVWEGTQNGIADGRGSRSLLQRAALVAAHAQDAPDSLIRSDLLPASSIAYSNVRGLAQLAKVNHLSFFATSVGARLERMSLPKAGHSLPPRSTVVKPSSGSVLRGEVSLTASATSDYPLKAVDFRISGSPTGAAIVLHGADYGEYGWQAGWSSTALPNGSYSVQSIARDIAGHVSTSHAVPFTIEN
jgi:Bacterial Ig domain